MTFPGCLSAATLSTGGIERESLGRGGRAVEQECGAGVGPNSGAGLPTNLSFS